MSVHVCVCVCVCVCFHPCMHGEMFIKHGAIRNIHKGNWPWFFPSLKEKTKFVPSSLLSSFKLDLRVICRVTELNTITSEKGKRRKESKRALSSKPNNPLVLKIKGHIKRQEQQV